MLLLFLRFTQDAGRTNTEGQERGFLLFLMIGNGLFNSCRCYFLL